MNPRPGGAWSHQEVVKASTQLAHVVRARMEQKRLSVRGLARLAGISHSAVSRLLSGRSRPNVETLRSLAAVLDLTLEEVLGTPRATPVRGDAPERTYALFQIDTPPEHLRAEVGRELDHLKVVANTGEAVAAARERFDAKVEALGAEGPMMDRLRHLRRLYLSAEDIAPAIRLVAGSAVLYFIQAGDAIDDHLWPIGYLDDAVAVDLAEEEIRRLEKAEAP